MARARGQVIRTVAGSGTACCAGGCCCSASFARGLSGLILISSNWAGGARTIVVIISGYAGWCFNFLIPHIAVGAGRAGSVGIRLIRIAGLVAGIQRAVDIVVAPGYVRFGVTQFFASHIATSRVCKTKWQQNGAEAQ